LECPNVETISTEAFYYNSSLVSISFSKIKKFDAKAFYSSERLYNLKEVFFHSVILKDVVGLSSINSDSTSCIFYVDEENVATATSAWGGYRVALIGDKVGTYEHTYNGVTIDLGEYVIADTSATSVISRYNVPKIDNDYTIPSVFNYTNSNGESVTKTVTEIYNYAYYLTTFENVNLYISDNITVIGKSAFVGTEKSPKEIKYIDFANVKNIKADALDNLYHLVRFNDDNVIETLGTSVFGNCYSLVEAKLPKLLTIDHTGNTRPDSSTFINAKSLVKLEIGENYNGTWGTNLVTGATNLRQFIFKVNNINQLTKTYNIGTGITLTDNIKFYVPEECYSSFIALNAKIGVKTRVLGDFVGDYSVTVTTPYNHEETIVLGDYTVSKVTINNKQGISLNSVNYDLTDIPSNFTIPNNINELDVIQIGKSCFEEFNFNILNSVNEKNDNIEIPETVTVLEENSFKNSSVRFHDFKNIERIEKMALYGCTNIYYIESNSITFVGISGCYGMSNLVMVNLPNLVEVETNAFSACTNVISLMTNAQKYPETTWWSETSLLELSYNVEEENGATYKYSASIGKGYIVLTNSLTYNTNEYCNQRDISTVKKVGENIIEIKDTTGLLIHKFDLGLYYVKETGSEISIFKYLKKSVDENYYVPTILNEKTVTEIGKYAYSYTNFNSNELHLPTTITNIENNAFYYSYAGGVLNLKNVETIGASSFAVNNFTKVIAPKLGAIYASSFQYNNYLEEIIAPSCTVLNSYAITNCPNLKVIRFTYLPNIYTQTLSNNLTVILEGKITSETEITESYVKSWISGSLGVTASKNTFLVPYESLQYYQKTDLSKAILNHYGELFDNSGEDGQSEIYILEEKDGSWKILSILTKKTDLVIPDSYNDLPITHISKNAFIGATSVENVTLPKYYSHYEDMTLNNALVIESVSISEENEYFATENGVLYSKGFKELIFYPMNKEESNFTTNENTEIIRSYSFNNCLHLKDLTLTNKVKILGTYAFDNTMLKTLTVESESLYTTGTEVFYTDNDLLVIYVPDDSLSYYQKLNAFQDYTIDVISNKVSE